MIIGGFMPEYLNRRDFPNAAATPAGHPIHFA
jgi:hypothetical protein